MKQAITYITSGISAIFLFAFHASVAFAQINPAPVMINGASYISIDSLSRQKGFQFQWDPILKNALVTSSSGFVKLHVDSEFILAPQGLVKLREKVRYFQGEAMAPLSAAPYFDQIVPSVSAVSLPPPHRIKKVVIDAGHGGYDLGAISPSGIEEKVLALKVAKMVADEMTRIGIDVTMTRSHDVFIPLPQRSRIANQAQADLFISIHANASPSRSLKGFEVYYLSKAADDMAVALENAENSESLLGTAQVPSVTRDVKAIYLDLEASENRRESIHAAQDIATAVQASVITAAKRVKSAQFHVLKWTECPSILVEMGYLTNSEDEKRLNNPVYQEQLARGIFRGFLHYKIEFERTDGFAQ